MKTKSVLVIDVGGKIFCWRNVLRCWWQIWPFWWHINLSNFFYILIGPSWVEIEHQHHKNVINTMILRKCFEMLRPVICGQGRLAQAAWDDSSRTRSGTGTGLVQRGRSSIILEWRSRQRRNKFLKIRMFKDEDFNDVEVLWMPPREMI